MTGVVKAVVILAAAGGTAGAVRYGGIQFLPNNVQSRLAVGNGYVMSNPPTEVQIYSKKRNEWAVGGVVGVLVALAIWKLT